ncbi:MAG: hypothetical protein IT172_09995 [Acidobacteria bacterium]|nr:hypothetical protein [Acidobacteriota bacterium]
MNTSTYNAVLIFGAILIAATFSFGQECRYWHAVVGVKGITISNEYVDESKTQNIIDGIGCLLSLEGDVSRGAFGMATNNRVSQQLPMSTVEICALYYISKLYWQRFDHADGVVLVDKNGRMNTSASIKKAFKSYRKWFEKVKKRGFEESRRDDLDPLAGSGVKWY